MLLGCRDIVKLIASIKRNTRKLHFSAYRFAARVVACRPVDIERKRLRATSFNNKRLASMRSGEHAQLCSAGSNCSFKITDDCVLFREKNSFLQPFKFKASFIFMQPHLKLVKFSKPYHFFKFNLVDKLRFGCCTRKNDLNKSYVSIITTNLLNLFLDQTFGLIQLLFIKAIYVAQQLSDFFRLLSAVFEIPRYWLTYSAK